MNKFLIALCLIIPLVASAKLGETVAQLDARFGRLDHADDDDEEKCQVRVYGYKDYIVNASVADGKCILEAVAHRDQSSRLSDAECVGIAQALTGATNWEMSTHLDLITIWHSGDFTATRFESKTPKTNPSPEPYTCMMRIEGKEYGEHEKKLGAEKEKAARAAENAEIKSFADKFNAPGTNRTPVETEAPTNSDASKVLAEAEKKSAEEKAKAPADAASRLLKWHQELADKRDPYGEFKMGMRYLTGDGVDKDIAKARALLSDSASQGNRDAAEALSKIK